MLHNASNWNGVINKSKNKYITAESFKLLRIYPDNNFTLPLCQYF